jgi:hypothetical protein
MQHGMSLAQKPSSQCAQAQANPVYPIGATQAAVQVVTKSIAVQTARLLLLTCARARICSCWAPMPPLCRRRWCRAQRGRPTVPAGPCSQRQSCAGCARAQHTRPASQHSRHERASAQNVCVTCLSCVPAARGSHMPALPQHCRMCLPQKSIFWPSPFFTEACPPQSNNV